MRSQLTGGDPLSFEYLLNYIAMKLQKPQCRIDTALCFLRTSQGVGKGQWWLAQLFGPSNCTSCSNLEHVFSNFNSHLSSSLWLILEEVKSGGKGWENSDRLKDLISSTAQMWEEKFKVAKSGKWFGQVVIFSNHSFGVRLENSDRRHVVFDTKADRRDDKQFHDQIATETQNSDFMATAYQALVNRDVSQWNWRQLPVTRTRDIIKRGCESPWLKFTRWLFEDESNFDTMCAEEYGSFCPEYVQWTTKGSDVSITTYPDHLAYLFKQCRDRLGFHCKVNEVTVMVDSIAFLWGTAAKFGRYRTSKCKRGVRGGIRISSVLGLQAVLSKHTRSTVLFGCFEK